VSNGNGKVAGVVEQGLSKVRRFWLVKARKDYVSGQKVRRTGECARCALCCRVLFRCPFLNDNTCSIYHSRFEQCKAFPIDARDIDLIRQMDGKCGFGFTEDAR
jgi:hypothetical protein